MLEKVKLRIAKNTISKITTIAAKLFSKECKAGVIFYIMLRLSL